MAYSSEEIIEPFWAEYSSEASGRDPLAIQNSSVVIYTKMIVGITNVTNRLRYNGFYCWLLNIIIQKLNKKNSIVEQIRYLRRAELLLAYMMVVEYKETTGVSGSAYAAKNIRSKISLKNGADWDTKKDGGPGLYWKFKSGVFGQYYSGVVRDLNLINHPHNDIDLNIYTLTEKGKVLAISYEKNIPIKEQILFWDCVYNGSVSQSELANLKSFALHIIPPGTDECLFYSNMLLAEDDRKIEPAFHRKNTIKLILKYLSTENKGVVNLPAAFLRYNYTENYILEILSNGTSMAWYLFEINEIIHVIFEHFHACFLYDIETFPTNIDVCIDKLVNNIQDQFKIHKIDSKALSLNQLAGIVAKKTNSVYDYYDYMETAFNEDNHGECLLNGIMALLKLYSNSKMQLEQLKEFAELPENNFNRTGYAIELFEDLIQSKFDLTINEYSKAILLQAINRHTFSSYSKTRIGQSLVHNYMIEDNTVWRLRETLPGRTSPRLQNVVQYLTDLGWLEKDNKNVKISHLGIKILNGL